jgi:hypothetical protein
MNLASTSLTLDPLKVVLEATKMAAMAQLASILDCAVAMVVTTMAWDAVFARVIGLVTTVNSLTSVSTAQWTTMANACVIKDGLAIAVNTSVMVTPHVMEMVFAVHLDSVCAILASQVNFVIRSARVLVIALLTAVFVTTASTATSVTWSAPTVALAQMVLVTVTSRGSDLIVRYLPALDQTADATIMVHVTLTSMSVCATSAGLGTTVELPTALVNLIATTEVCVALISGTHVVLTVTQGGWVKAVSFLVSTVPKPLRTPSTACVILAGLVTVATESALVMVRL